MLGFIKRLLGIGGRPPAAVSAGQPVRPAPAPGAMPSAPTPVRRAAPAVVLQRDEMIDSKTRIAGYRFAVHCPETGQPPEAAASLDILLANQVANFAERRQVVIPLPLAAWAQVDYTPLIAANTIFLLACPDNAADAAALTALADAIHAAGARVALAGGRDPARHAALLAQVDFVLLDFSAFALPELERLVNALREERPGLGFMVDKLGSWPEYRYCVSRGMTYCFGQFTTAPDDAPAATEIGESRLVLIDMLNLLRKEADLADVAQAAKRDPGVLVKLMSMANSPLFGLTHQVVSIDQAIMVLGREKLYRWLSVGMFRAGTASPRDEVLLELALARARFLEALGQEKHSRLECDELFLLGLLSLLDTLFGVPMSEVVARIHLLPELSAALLDSNGPLARYLMLSVAVEKGHVQNVARLAEQLGYTLEAVESATVEAIGWAEAAAHLAAA